MLAHSTGPHTLSLAYINAKCFTWNLPLEPLQTKKKSVCTFSCLSSSIPNLQLPCVQPPTSLQMVIMVVMAMVIRLSMLIIVTKVTMVETVIIVTINIMVDMVIIIVVVMIVMVIRTDRTKRTHGTNNTDMRKDRQI